MPTQTLQSRDEQYLEALVNFADTQGLPAPMSRNDAYFLELIEKIHDLKTQLGYIMDHSNLVIDSNTQTVLDSSDTPLIDSYY